MPASYRAIEVFCSYMNADELYRRQLETHVSLLKRQGLISLWHDQQILPGSNRTHAIDEHLETASIIVLLISADFIASDHCYDVEMKRALERHGENSARVVPIVVRPCEWQQLPLATLQALPTGGKPVSQWTSEDEAWTQVTAGLRRVIEDLSLLSTNTSRSTLPSTWMIPYPRNPFFHGRDELLAHIHTQLQAGETTALSRPQALSGLGGIGKTQIAVEYGYRYSQEYQMILWAQAESIETLDSSYSQLAVKLNLPEKEEEKQKIIIEAVKTWLQEHHHWLLILDNADELALLQDFLPVVIGGHLLITTRASSTGQLARRIEVETFTEEQGALFLLRRASQLASDAPLSQAATHDQRFAREISHELGGLPLALDQAGAYLEQTGYSLSDYQQIYQSHRVSLLSLRGGLVKDHPDPIALTWALSFEHVKQKNWVATKILHICAYLSADAIPLALMTEGVKPVTQDLFVLGQAIETLRAYSLVSHDPVTRTLSIHRLVQAVMRDRMSVQEQNVWIKRAVQRVETTFPNPWQISEWKACESWLSHVWICAFWIEQAHMVFLEAAILLYQAGYYLSRRARYGEAEDLYQRALSIGEKQLGLDHPDVAYPLNGLASLYHEQGKYGEAEPLYQRALSISEKQLGPDHPGVAPPLNNLANLYVEQGKYGEAEPLYQRVLSIGEKQSGPDHPDVAAPLGGLANLYHEQGKYGEAEPLYQRVLSIREKQLGPDHPSMAFSLNNLAELYRRQEKYGEAEPLYQQALQIKEKQLGPDHPDVAYFLHNLAILYSEQGKYGEAEELCLRVLSIREKQLGPDHTLVATTLNNLANLYKEQKKYGEAEDLYQRALSISEKQLGPDHPQIAGSLNNLALLYDDQGKSSLAERVCERALQISSASLGREHPQTQQILGNHLRLLAQIYTNGDVEKFLDLLAQEWQNNHKNEEAVQE